MSADPDNFFAGNDEIVALMWEGKVITEPKHLLRLVHGKPDARFVPISRAMCRLANICDLGEKWHKMATESPTLFKIDTKKLMQAISRQGSSFVDFATFDDCIIEQ
jgi:hypothetical protein